ncbi:Cytochrome c oxidase subunit 7, mitochondrial [Nakaseomyces bracarensis]|uniref:Cytochrome c oxidase subunit 7, mitochondrial n=1 Tax=Nakaseomyces bracarensis TaxID=273131 RepID=A0ABR4NZB8_9SACH
MANNVTKLQRLFQASSKPIWWRHPRSAFYLYPYYGLLAVAVLAPICYIPNAVLGIKAKKNLA